MQYLNRYLPFLLPLALCGCDLDDLLGGDFDAGTPLQTVEAADVEGTWTIRGRGKMRKCAVDELNTDHFVFDSKPLDVTQQTAAPETDGGVATTATLTLADAPAGHQLGCDDFCMESGQVEGNDVRFITREATPRGTLRLEFVGEVNEVGQIAGEFTGTGPADFCESSGSFIIDVN